MHIKITGSIPLSSLELDGSARFHDCQLTAEDRDTLHGLGLTEGAMLRVCKQGEPCVIQVRATRIAISSRVARAISVKRDASQLPMRG